MGFEPTTLWLVTRCSTTELLSHWAKNQNRTDNLFITSEVLYQLSYFSILRWYRLPSRDWYHYVTSYFYSDFLSRLRVSNSPPKIGSLPCHQQHLVCIIRRKTVTATSRFFLLLLKFWQNVARPKLTSEPLIGFEPTTPSLQVKCTTSCATKAYCWRGGIRTPVPLREQIYSLPPLTTRPPSKMNLLRYLKRPSR